MKNYGTTPYEQIKGLIDRRKPTHGSCCTCQECGYDHDYCRCEKNNGLYRSLAILDIKQLIADKGLNWTLNFISHEYEEDTKFLSFEEYDHPMFKCLLNLGIDAVPLILSKMRFNPDWWMFPVISAIAKEDIEIPDDEKGRFVSIIKRFLKWGLEKKYINDDTINFDEQTI